MSSLLATEAIRQSKYHLTNTKALNMSLRIFKVNANKAKLVLSVLFPVLFVRIILKQLKQLNH